jgi:hypothetical protein
MLITHQSAAYLSCKNTPSYSKAEFVVEKMINYHRPEADGFVFSA